MAKRDVYKRQRKYFAPQNEGTERKCDHPGCEKAGEYRAPKDRKLKDYYWFCLEHVQEYNAQWNYYAGEIPEEDEGPKARMHFKGFRSKVRYKHCLLYTSSGVLLQSGN